jgi:hypothetical protein
MVASELPPRELVATITWEANPMKSTETVNGMSPELKAEMQEACKRITSGIPFTKEEKDRAAAEIDRMREENAKLFGVEDVTLDILRQIRSR